MKLEKLTEGILFSHPVEETDRPILAGIRGDEFTLIIDAGNSQAHYQEFETALADQAFPKRNAVVLTHWHWDHIFGAASATGPVLAHRLTREKMMELKGYEWTDGALEARVQAGTEIEFCRSCIVKELPSPRQVAIRIPEIEVEDSLIVDLGRTRCVIEHIGSEHAKDHLIIYSEEDRVLFIGDILFVELYDGEWYWTPGKVERLIDRLLSYPAEWVVASHVYPVQSRAAFEAECAWIRWIGEVVEAMDSLEAAKKMIGEKDPQRAEEGMEMAGWFFEGLKRETEKIDK
jgi:glyoxylase-like metal-dependent hydrolase (beta-lactamase superfamily II)